MGGEGDGRGGQWEGRMTGGEESQECEGNKDG